jgi:hypothetical protein
MSLSPIPIWLFSTPALQLHGMRLAQERMRFTICC